MSLTFIKNGNNQIGFAGQGDKKILLNPNFQIPALTIENGTLKLNGVSFSGIGVNYYSAFERVLDNSNDLSYEEGFRMLALLGIKFARLDISGFWPIKTNLFFTNRNEYFRRLDGVIISAAKHNVALIPTFFWAWFTFSDLAGENLDQLAVTDSLTRQKMREFATEVINRYKNYRNIWAWEFGNEWNLQVDLPNATEFLPPTFTNLGNPATRDPERDILTTDLILPILTEFANLAKQLDPERPISTGHTTPRPSQWHQDQWKRGLLPLESAWDTDSNTEAEEITLKLNPDPYDLISLHFYFEDLSRVTNYTSYATNAGKVPFVGEFGTPPDLEANFASLLSTVKTNSPISTVWVYDRSEDTFNITANNSRKWMLQAIL
jgi:hypothetical protein